MTDTLYVASLPIQSRYVAIRDFIEAHKDQELVFYLFQRIDKNGVQYPVPVINEFLYHSHERKPTPEFVPPNCALISTDFPENVLPIAAQMLYGEGAIVHDITGSEFAHLPHDVVAPHNVYIHIPGEFVETDSEDEK